MLAQAKAVIMLVKILGSILSILAMISLLAWTGQICVQENGTQNIACK